jgi:hypothetical protein
VVGNKQALDAPRRNSREGLFVSRINDLLSVGGSCLSVGSTESMAESMAGDRAALEPLYYDYWEVSPVKESNRQVLSAFR